MSIILFIVLLTFLILIHELGHLLVALWCKVKVEEFGIGLPPKAKTLFHWRGIPITLNWIFMGGFVRMEGEEGPGGPNSQFPISNFQKKTSSFPFYQRSLLQKLAIVVAGPLVNFSFGVLVFACIFSIYGIPTKVLTSPTLASIAVNAPASDAGLQVGDSLLSVMDAGRTAVTVLDSNETLIAYINTHRGETLHLQIERAGQKKELDVYARRVDETPDGQGAMGIELASQYEIKQYPLIERPFRGILAGLSQSFEFGKTILTSLGGIGRTIAHGNVPQDVSGPVGIATQVQKQGVFTNGWLSALNFAALLSINLAVMNLLPIPALDGGRAVLLIVEKFIKGKRFQIVSYWLNTGGFIFLLAVLLLITLKDIVSILL